MPKVKVLLARFPFGNAECPDATDWLVEAVLKLKAHPHVGAVGHRRVDDTPITMGRNRVLREARAAGVDYVLMLDSDMRPDLPGPGALPFLPTALDFALEHPGPCCVAAPYCGPPPHENVYVFRWGKKQNDHPNTDLSIDQFGREEAAHRCGFEEVAALPTGLILIDMRALGRLPPPWFEYEWKDKYADEKASTEDVYFTRNLSLAGVPQFVFWDAWAGHWKRKLVTKPQTLTCDSVREQFRDAVGKNHERGEALLHVGEGKARRIPRVNHEFQESLLG